MKMGGGTLCKGCKVKSQCHDMSSYDIEVRSRMGGLLGQDIREGDGSRHWQGQLGKEGHVETYEVSSHVG